MKTAAITLFAAALAASFQDYALGSEEEPHWIRKREVNCSEIPDIGSPWMNRVCCGRTIELLDERPHRHRGSHERRGHTHRGHGHHRSSWSSANNSSEEEHRRHEGSGRLVRIPRRAPRHELPRPDDPEERVRCIVEEQMQNEFLAADGRLNGQALGDHTVDLLTPNTTAWRPDKVREIVHSCVATPEQLVAEIPTNCTSGASDWIVCLLRQAIVHCPDEYWEDSVHCNSFREYLIACPNGPPPPPPRRRHRGRHAGGRGRPPP
ncbi:uncharacterized protein LOC134540765 [Bacillus rossius redtenbacheri]|uniref:uncharacterized protein LOC134540765 n=1 Tax=Bacillus rossius redtenbacheri TaxID=93214 RepID=UPI002FDC92D8